MSRAPRVAGLAVCLALAISALLPAPAAPQDGEPEIYVLITSPEAGRPAFGEVVFEVEAWPAELVERVELKVDGLVVDTPRRPPYRLTVAVGAGNEGHLFEAVAHAASGAVARATVTTPRVEADLEVDVELQQLYVTVTRDGRSVSDLPREAFTVLDEGRPQKLVTFERGDVPLTAVLLLDASLSMRGRRLAAALDGARAFVEDMQPLDEARLFLFSDHLVHATPFTSVPELLTVGLGGVRAGGGTALNDHLYMALKLLEERQGRRVVVILSEGVDVESVLDMEEVLWKVRHSQTLVYWLRLRDESRELMAGDELLPQHSWWRGTEEHQLEFRLLGRGVAESGGRIVDISGADEVVPAFRAILAELRGQYVLGYYPDPPKNDGGWRRVKVRLGEPGLEVRAREGYVDF